MWAFEWLEKCPRQLVNNEEDVTAGNLLKIRDNIRDGLLTVLVLLAQAGTGIA